MLVLMGVVIALDCRIQTYSLQCRDKENREERVFKTPLLVGLAITALAFESVARAADLPEACTSYKPAVTGGPMPPANSEVVVLRWLANANFEFAYKSKVYLFDAYFDRTPRSHSLGFKAADVTKAEAIFVSHAHFDHISDIGPVAKQTGAPVVGAPITAETAKKLGAPEAQIVVAKGGETLKYGDATVEVALAQHSTIQAGLLDIYQNLYNNNSPAFSDQEKTLLNYVRSLGTFDPKIITEGTLAYALTFPSGFHSASCSSRSCSCPRTTMRRRRPGSIFASSHCSTRSVPRCRIPHFSRRSIVRRSAFPPPALPKAKSCRSGTSHRLLFDTFVRAAGEAIVGDADRRHYTNPQID